MCLDKVDEKVRTNGVKREGKYIVVWKTVKRPVGRNRRWAPLYHGKPFKPGWNVSKKRGAVGYGGEYYVPHFHSYTSKQAARRRCLSSTTRTVIKCKIEQKDITATGIDGNHRTIIAKRILMPKYPNRE